MGNIVPSPGRAPAYAGSACEVRRGSPQAVVVPVAGSMEMPSKEPWLKLQGLLVLILASSRAGHMRHRGADLLLSRQAAMVMIGRQYAIA